RTSASESAVLPPLGGIAPLPFNADCRSVSMPCWMRGAQADLSPSLGEPATPVEWQAVHVLSNTFLPSAAAPAAGLAAPAACGCARPRRRHPRRRQTPRVRPVGCASPPLPTSLHSDRRRACW